MNYDFIDQLNKQSQKEAVRICLNYELQQGKEVKDVSEDSKWFEKGVDLIIIQPDGDIWIDVKCDERIHETKNVAVELIEIASINGFIKKGYFYSDIDYIYYFDWHNKKFYKFKLKTLQEITFFKARKGFSAFHPKQKYFTLGVLVPLEELI